MEEYSSVQFSSVLFYIHSLLSSSKGIAKEADRSKSPCYGSRSCPLAKYLLLLFRGSLLLFALCYLLLASDWLAAGCWLCTRTGIRWL